MSDFILAVPVHLDEVVPIFVEQKRVSINSLFVAILRPRYVGVATKNFAVGILDDNKRCTLAISLLMEVLRLPAIPASTIEQSKRLCSPEQLVHGQSVLVTHEVL